MTQKRIKISGEGDWWNSTVTCDGVELNVRGVEISVGLDQMTAVRLVLDATDVQFDIQSPAEVPGANRFRPAGPQSLDLTIKGSDLVSTLNREKRNRGE